MKGRPSSSSISVLLLLLYSIPTIARSFGEQTAQNDCSSNSTTVRVLVLFDITPENARMFRNQQNRLVSTLRHIDDLAKANPRYYALVAFHRISVVLSGLNYAQATNVEKIIDIVSNLNPRRRLEISPTKALETAEELILEHQQQQSENNNMTMSKNIVILVHDGRNTDMVADTMEAGAKLAKISATIFAIAGGDRPNEQMLSEYTRDQAKVFSSEMDGEKFLEAIDKELNLCDVPARSKLSTISQTTTSKIVTSTSVTTTTTTSTTLPKLSEPQKSESPVSKSEQTKSEATTRTESIESETTTRIATTAFNVEKTSKTPLSPLIKRDDPCGTGNNAEKLDLMVLLDTSASMFLVFQHQRQLALDLLARTSARLQAAPDALRVGIVQFAHEPTVLHSLREPVDRTRMLDRVRAIEFTGRNTLIADAFELGLKEFEQFGRKDAQKILVLISDGHGQEFWQRAQEVARKLQAPERSLQLFAVSTSLNYNLNELVLYIGDPSRVFVGQRHFSFLSSITGFLRKCLPKMAIDETKDDEEIVSKNAAKEAELEFERAMMVSAKGRNLELDSIEANNDTEIRVPSSSGTAQDPNLNLMPKTGLAVSLEKRESEDEVVSDLSKKNTQDDQKNTDQKKSTDQNIDQTIGDQIQSGQEEANQKSDQINANKNQPIVKTGQEIDLSMGDQKQTNQNADDQKTDHNGRGPKPTLRTDQQTDQNVVVRKQSGHEEADRKPDQNEKEQKPTLRTDQKTDQGMRDRKQSGQEVADRKPDQNLVSQKTVQKEENQKQADQRAGDQKKQNQRQPDQSPPDPTDCTTDLLIMADLAKPPDVMIKHGALLLQLLQRVPRADVKSGKIRLGAITFGTRGARLEAGWAEQLGWAEFAEKLDMVQPTKTGESQPKSSFVEAAKLAIEQLTNARRPGARAILIVLWSGVQGRDNSDELDRALDSLNTVNGTEVFAATLGPDPDLDRLKRLAGGDQWHVFVQARTEQFVPKVSRFLSECVLPPSGSVIHRATAQASTSSASNELDNHEPLNSVERVEHLQAAAKAFQRQEGMECQNDTVDLAILLHFRPPSGRLTNDLSGQFHAMRKIAMDALRQAPAEHYRKRIRLSLLINGRIQVSLKTAIDLDDALFALDRIELDRAELVAKRMLIDYLEQSLDDLKRHHRNGARVVLLLLSNDAQQPELGAEHQSQTVMKALESLSATLYILNFAPNGGGAAPDGPMTGGSGSANIRVFHSGAKMHRFVDEFRRKAFNCRKREIRIVAKQAVAADSALPADESMATTTATNNDTVSSGSVKLMEDGTNVTTTVGEKDQKRVAVEAKDAGEESGTENRLDTATSEPQSTSRVKTVQSPTVRFDLHQERPRVLFEPDNDCKVDLMFIIDTSQSVAEEFREQLQLAVDLVKRLPDHDFAQRVQIGAVSFFQTARVHFTLGELKDKSAVLDALLDIKHTGGSTSVASGVDLAMDEVAKRRRKGTRLMVVLITDGNSQDSWDAVVRSAQRMHAARAHVYALTVSNDYMFRELELYTGNKWFVYVDARVNMFLDEAEMSLMQCKSPSAPAEVSIITRAADAPANLTRAFDVESCVNGSEADDGLVDLMFVMDTSTTNEKEFYAEKTLAMDLVRMLPKQDFMKRISIALVKFDDKAHIHFHFHAGRRREDILYDIEGVEHTGGQTNKTNLATAAELAYREIFRLRRPMARLIVILITDGNSQDKRPTVKEAAKKLRDTTGGDGVYAVSLSEKQSLEELLEYTGSEERIYMDARADVFIREMSNVISKCREHARVNPVPEAEESTTPPINLNSTKTDGTLTSLIPTHKRRPIRPKQQDQDKKAQESKELVMRGRAEDGSFTRNENPIQSSGEVTRMLREDEQLETDRRFAKCRHYSKMDLIIILDASTSRENVFEHQRELALSLIERLPISAQDTHVATGINSFTDQPMLRQTLGLGRDRKMVRKAIEDIRYRGGSTLTARAVELALQDLQRGRRDDALQVVVLMNDGMSQDPWEEVLEGARKLDESGAERFGVALGEDVDLRELRKYIGNDERIYRDGSTERFLQDVVALLDGSGEGCPATEKRHREPSRSMIKGAKTSDLLNTSDQPTRIEFQEDNICDKPNLDLLVVLDNGNEEKLNANRYLLLDVLGSLPQDNLKRVRVALITVAGGGRLEHRLDDPQSHDTLAQRIERVRTANSNGSHFYASAIDAALRHYASARRADARALLLLLGDGNGTTDSPEERARVSERLRKTQGLSTYAVDSGTEVDTENLLAYLDSTQHIFPYDRNAEFAKFLQEQAKASEHCQEGQSVPAHQNATQAQSQKKKRVLLRRQRLHDIATLHREDKTVFGVNAKLVVGPKQQSEKQRVDALERLLKMRSGQDREISTTTTRNESTTDVVQQRQQKLEFTSRGTTPAPAKDGRTTLSTLTPSSAVRMTTSSSSTRTATSTTTSFRPGCLIDLMLIIDASGSMHSAFEREKALASDIVRMIRIGPENARVAIVKFASAGKTRTVHGFNSAQTKEAVLSAIAGIGFSDGITAIHSALQQAIVTYSPLKGARPGQAEPVAIVFTDGFAKQDFAEEARLLRRLVPTVYAVAVQDGVHEAVAHPRELAAISGEPARVYTAERSRAELTRELRERFRGC